MDRSQSAELRTIAIEAALLVRAPLAAAFRSEMAIDYKVDLHDIVTKHDRQAEETIRSHILERLPGSTIVGEEYGASGEGRGGSRRGARLRAATGSALTFGSACGPPSRRRILRLPTRQD